MSPMSMRYLTAHLTLLCLSWQAFGYQGVDIQVPLLDVNETSTSLPLLELLDRLRESQPEGDIGNVHEAILAQSFQDEDLALKNSSGYGEHNSAKFACNLCLRTFGPEKVIRPSDLSYEAQINENWSQNCHLPAACILKAKNAVDVAIMLRIVRDLGAQFSIRSGGMNPNPGFSSIGGNGVLIDLENLNTMRLSEDRKTVAVGPGARWGEVYKYLDPHGISAVGSRSPVPAVGGFIAGCGIPFIPSLTGFGCDNVKNFEVVLGNCSIINANASSNSDLFLALKGAGSNFGVVTRYDLYTSVLHDTWYKFDLYNVSDSSDILEATFQTQKTMEDDPKAHFIWVAHEGSILIGLIYGQWTAHPPVFEAFESLKPTSHLFAETNGTISSLSQSLNFLYSTTATREIYGFSHKIDLDFYQRTFVKYKAMAKFSESPGTDLSYTIQPISKAAVTAGQARGGNILGIEMIEQTWFNAVAQFTLPADAEPARQTLGNLRAMMESEAKKDSLFLPFLFHNDASVLEGQNPLASYGTESLTKLRDASEKYDPGQVFQNVQFASFKVRDA